MTSGRRGHERAPDLDAILAAALAAFAERRILVAVSGGLDSEVLLHAAAAYARRRSIPIAAVHVDHALHADSPLWAQRSRASAAALAVPCAILTVDDTPPPGGSVEAWARTRRYRAIEAFMADGDVVVTAHHEDDVAETLLLQLLRGAGPHGLAAIAPVRPFGRGHLARPLLAATRRQLHDYAVRHGLRWSEDPSNADERHDRNFLRHRVLPLLRERWPAANERIAHAARLQRDSAACLDTVADRALADATRDDDGLSIASLGGLAPAAQRWILRRWIERAGLPLPDRTHLLEIQRMLDARPDAQPLVRFKTVEIRRYRDRLVAARAVVRPGLCSEYAWHLPRTLRLPHGELSVERAIAAGIRASAVARGCRVRFRRGGERCRPAGRRHRMRLKHLFQEWGVPAWQRDRIPLVYVGEEIAAVAGFCVCDPFAAAAGEPGWLLHWRPAADASASTGC